MNKKLFLVGLFSLSISVFAQKKTPENWQTKDPMANKIYGTGAEEAYKTLGNKESKKVIVAVIDSGVDIEHEDLKDVIWTNPGEIPDNGIDDDKNGYIDDVHGWSFLGGNNGDINYEATELARIYQKMNKMYAFKDTTKLKTSADKSEYEYYKKIKNEFLTDQEDKKQQLMSLYMVSAYMQKAKAANNGVLNKKALKKYKPENEMETRMKKGLKLAFTFGLKPEELEDQIKQGIDVYGNMVKYNEMNMDSVRQYTVGDDPANFTNRFYGCNRVKGPDALHGTHVAGIIAASRNNKIGIDGIANNVIIMPVRAVPNGDERDKDVANAIRYAVDNGATIINMSFGKYYSPEKNLVDEAIEYAKSKDVLLIHAAGNESKDKDVEISYPTRELDNKTIASNWIEVGASGYKAGSNIIGSFSNYGKTKVDLFAPGVDIYSTVPDNNKYIYESGTSMAAPSTAGVAAIIRAYFPELKAEEVRNILMQTVVTYEKEVTVPGTKNKKKVADLCVSGGFLNANNAVMKLMGISPKKK